MNSAQLVFAMAYRAWLDRAEATTGPEPKEPSPAGLAKDPAVAARLGECIARAVRVDFERARIEQAKARKV